MNDDGTLGGLPARLSNDLDEAFPDLVRSLQSGIFSGVLQITRHRHDAEDITQETFVRAYRALREYDVPRIGGLRIRPWVWTIALNLCRNRARSRSRRPPPMASAIEPLDQDMGPEETAVARSMLSVWSRRLSDLSDAQRTAVVLRHVVGLSYAEISQATDRPEGTVKADVHRGLEQLRRQLSKEESLI